MALIETHELTKQFGSLTAVEDVSIHVDAGEILALLGPNGAGKTTTIRMLASILRPTRGTVTIQGQDAVDQAIEVRRSVGLLTEHHGLYTRMRVHEYLMFFGRVYGLPHDAIRSRIDALLERYGLSEAVGLRLGQFSKGMRQKLALVRAMLHNPPILLLDEPTSAMDPASAHLVRESITGLRSSNRAIVVCTHNLHEAELLADRIAIIRLGKIVAEGSPRELKRALLGSPVMELRLTVSLDGAMKLLPAELTVVARGQNWLRYETCDPETDNPRILQAMSKAGIPVVTLSEVERSLEDVYLQVVSEDTTRSEERE
ncbi:MAG: ATP-binding cassette domain-containing protein [Anaerolineales bacterium]|nr:ATP-binding cassette domain-containing protein [Anaerolineales bacterium]